MRDEFKSLDNWHNRGYLPHYDAKNKGQMISYRLADSLPQEVLKTAGSAGGSPAEQAKKRKLIEGFLDKGYGSCLLKHPEAAKIVIENWLYFDQKNYDLIAFVVMPNHVHLLIKTYETVSLSQIVHSWKSYTSKELGKLLINADEPSALPGGDLFCSANADEPSALLGISKSKVWQEDYWDRFIRDQNHFNRVIDYIHNNPQKAGLITEVNKWSWSSLNYSKT